MAVYAIVIILVTWTTAFALPKTPEYFSMFAWMSTYGGFAIVVIYLLISVGALRGLKGHPKMWALYIACFVGFCVTVAAIYGAVYKVTAPTVYAPYAAIVILIVGLIAAAVMPKAPSGQADFSELGEAEQGPLKI
jgi:amino acid transporter